LGEGLRTKSASASRRSVARIQRVVVDALIDVLVLLVLVALVWAVLGVARDVWHAVTRSSIDASLAFVLREAWIGMYSGESDWRQLMALAFLILALGGVRTLAIVFSPSERELRAPAA
jgi:uncharacterized membrane protein (DUF373 family)